MVLGSRPEPLQHIPATAQRCAEPWTQECSKTKCHGCPLQNWLASGGWGLCCEVACVCQSKSGSVSGRFMMLCGVLVRQQSDPSAQLRVTRLASPVGHLRPAEPQRSSSREGLVHRQLTTSCSPRQSHPAHVAPPVPPLPFSLPWLLLPILDSYFETLGGRESWPVTELAPTKHQLCGQGW